MYPSGASFYPARVSLRVVRPHFLFVLANANPVQYRTTVAARICGPSCADAAVEEAARRALRYRNTASRDRSCVKHCASAYPHLALRVLLSQWERNEVRACPDFYRAHARSVAAPQTVRPLTLQNRF